MEGLKDDADVVATEFGQPVFAHGGEVEPVHQHFAGSGAFEAAQHEEQRGLAGAGRADDADRLAAICLKIDAAKNIDGAGAAHEGEANIVQEQERFLHLWFA